MDSNFSKRPPLAALTTSAVALLAFFLWYSTTTHDEPVAKPSGAGSASQPAAFTATESATVVHPATSTEPPSPAPRGDLAAAIEHAKAQRPAAPPAPPPGQASWQGMSAQDAAKVFGEAVRANEQTSAASPFQHQTQK